MSQKAALCLAMAIVLVGLGWLGLATRNLVSVGDSILNGVQFTSHSKFSSEGLGSRTERSEAELRVHSGAPLDKTWEAKVVAKNSTVSSERAPNSESRSSFARQYSRNFSGLDIDKWITKAKGYDQELDRDPAKHRRFIQFHLRLGAKFSEWSKRLVDLKPGNLIVLWKRFDQGDKADYGRQIIIYQNGDEVSGGINDREEDAPVCEITLISHGNDSRIGRKEITIQLVREVKVDLLVSPGTDRLSVRFFTRKNGIGHRSMADLRCSVPRDKGGGKRVDLMTLSDLLATLGAEGSFYPELRTDISVVDYERFEVEESD